MPPRLYAGWSPAPISTTEWSASRACCPTCRPTTAAPTDGAATTTTAGTATAGTEPAALIRSPAGDVNRGGPCGPPSVFSKGLPNLRGMLLNVSSLTGRNCPVITLLTLKRCAINPLWHPAKLLHFIFNIH